MTLKQLEAQLFMLNIYRAFEPEELQMLDFFEPPISYKNTKVNYYFADNAHLFLIYITYSDTKNRTITLRYNVERKMPFISPYYYKLRSFPALLRKLTELMQ